MSNKSEFIEILRRFLTTTREDPGYDHVGEIVNIVDGLFAIADSLDSVARQLGNLGNGNAATQMGAIEGLGAVIKEAVGSVSGSLESIADSIDRHQ